jgi:hypothetical protein
MVLTASDRKLIETELETAIEDRADLITCSNYNTVLSVKDHGRGDIRFTVKMCTVCLRPQLAHHDPWNVTCSRSTDAITRNLSYEMIEAFNEAKAFKHIAQWVVPSSDTATDSRTVYSLNSQTDYTGRKIFFDLNLDDSSVSSYFVAKWRSANNKLQGVLSYGKLLTTLSLAGNHYPLFANITQDFSPLILGKDFFDAYRWQYSNEGFIITPQGKLFTSLTPEGLHQIDTQLLEDVLRCEEVISQTKPRNQKLAKLHKYFAHASAESLWRLIKNSSNPDAYT